MKVALVSDIHGNAAALEAVLSAARAEGVERLLCCGDIVGYYYEPSRCLDLLSEWTIDCVRGNHEDMLQSLLASPSLAGGIRERYGSGLSIAASELSPERLSYLAALPEQRVVPIDGKTILLCHGAPWDAGFYVYPDAAGDIFRRCAEGGNDYVALGHTHRQLGVRHERTLIINPGSVGQARGGARGRAGWAVLDVETGWYRNMTTEYASAPVIEEAKRRDPDVAYLQSILTRDPMP
jgi:putative phosphoesterase